MLLIFCALLVAVAVVWAGWLVARSRAEPRDSRATELQLLTLFAPAAAAAADDPRALLAWQPLASMARTRFPQEFAALDRAAGATFPFTVEQIQSAHARWTAEWLAWERAHDGEYKLKAATVEHELGEAPISSYGRARLDAVEREKLDRYQRRYEEYSRIARALQALVPKS